MLDQKVRVGDTRSKVNEPGPDDVLAHDESLRLPFLDLCPPKYASILLLC